ncbi:YpoC family protein [Ectobacillus polymachus]|uniref:YpoC family protein n=1 Tax=Ectobacillus polymachus TaxID=1508806 RepID=UPI003A8BBA04
MTQIQVPNRFVMDPFYKEGDIISFEKETCVEEGDMFIFEIAAAEEIDLYQPWNVKEKTIPVILEIWKQDQEEIASLFRKRKRNEAKAPMIRHTARFVSILFWLNGTYISSLQQYAKEIEVLDLKPVNIVERLRFILEQPDHYHSFIQLSQLYEEARKLFGKMIVMKKNHLHE